MKKPLAHANPRPRIFFLQALTLFIAIGLIVGACSGRKRPFAKGSKAIPAGQFKKAPVVKIADIRGVSTHDSQTLRRQIIYEAHKRGIPASRQAGGKNTLVVNGTLRTAPYNQNTAIAYVWDFSDTKNKPLHRIAGETISRKSPQGPITTGLSAKSIQRIASHAAAGMAAWLGRQGYAVREISLPPPGSVRNIASVRAEANSVAARKAISRNLYATPTPQKVRVASIAQPGLAAPLLAQPQLAIPRQPAAPIVTASILSLRPTIVQTRYTPVVIQPVTGASAQTNVELTDAIKRALRLKGVPVADAPTKKTLKLVGTIKMGAVERKRRLVNIEWHLMKADGEKIGIVQQSNKVRLKTLSASWERTAATAARAAANDIARLVPQRTATAKKAQ